MNKQKYIIQGICFRNISLNRWNAYLKFERVKIHFHSYVGWKWNNERSKEEKIVKLNNGESQMPSCVWHHFSHGTIFSPLYPSVQTPTVRGQWRTCHTNLCLIIFEAILQESTSSLARLLEARENEKSFRDQQATHSFLLQPPEPCRTNAPDFL